MAIIFREEVWNRGITGTTTVYSASELNSLLAQAEKYYVSVHTSQPAGTAPKITLKLERSNDGATWDTQTPLTMINAVDYSATTDIYAQDTGASRVGGCFCRVTITLSATSGTPSGHFRIILTGRDDV